MVEPTKEQLIEALKWALDIGAVYSSPYKNQPSSIFDHGCGCCSSKTDIPPEYEPAIRFVVRQMDTVHDKE